MPSANDTNAVSVSPGLLTSCLTEYRRSCATVRISHRRYLPPISGLCSHYAHLATGGNCRFRISSPD